MSAILKTLKKLEEEKHLVKQNLDIEEMVKQTEVMAPAITRTRKTGFIATLLGLAGVMMTVYFVYQSKQPVANSSQVTNSLIRQPAAATTQKKPQAPKETQAASGIPLNQIPEAANSTPAEPQAPEAQTLEAKPPITEEDTGQSVKPKDTAQIIADALAGKDIAEATPPVALNEIHTLIEQAKLSARQQKKNPSRMQPRRNTIYIPGLKIKGIVFLTENNPVNHILVSTPDNSNRKLKVGQTVLNAKLTAIHVDKAVFLYKGQTTATGIGD